MCTFFLPSRLNESHHPGYGCVIFTRHSVEVPPPLPHVKVTLCLLECNHTPCAGEGSVINYPDPISGRRGHHPAHGCANLVFYVPPLWMCTFFFYPLAMRVVIRVTDVSSSPFTLLKCTHPFHM